MNTNPIPKPSPTLWAKIETKTNIKPESSEDLILPKLTHINLSHKLEYNISMISDFNEKPVTEVKINQDKIIKNGNT